MPQYVKQEPGPVRVLWYQPQHKQNTSVLFFVPAYEMIRDQTRKWWGRGLCLFTLAPPRIVSKKKKSQNLIKRTSFLFCCIATILSLNECYTHFYISYASCLVQTTADISLLRISMKPERYILLCQNYNSVYVFTVKLRSSGWQKTKLTRAYKNYVELASK